MGHLHNPYSKLSGKWFRGNLHAHTTESDGNLAPSQVVERYRNEGYDFLALTDHSLVTDVSYFSEQDFLVIAGEELSNPHVIALGIKERIADDFWFKGVINYDNLILELREVKQKNGIVIIPHPYWTGLTSHDLKQIEDEYLIEIYNAVCDVKWRKGYSVVHWDELLITRKPVWGVAVDDCHFIPGLNDFAKGWIWVNADQLSWEALAASLKKGQFFASQGPFIETIEVEGNMVIVTCTPCKEVAFLGKSLLGDVIRAPKDQLLTRAEYSFNPDLDRRYIRIECRDVNGKVAWSNPLFLLP